MRPFLPAKEPDGLGAAWPPAWIEGGRPIACAEGRRRHAGGPVGVDTVGSWDRPNYLEPWIVTLLLEYKEFIPKTDVQLGHVLKVLNEPNVSQNAERVPEILYIGDGHHYIEVVVAAKAVEKAKSSLPQSGFSGIIGQFLVLQHYRVCFKAATEMEDCQFYLILEGFRVMPMKRQERRLQDCNKEPSVLQKIKELWKKNFVMPRWLSSEESPSLSQVLNEINQGQLNTLKQNAKDCLNLLDPSKLLDSEQLAVYPDTKWQLKRKQDKVHQDIFTVPAKFLVISAENEAALSQSYTSKTLQSVPKADEDIQDDDRSTISFFSAADSVSLDGSLENPWDAFPGLALNSSSDTSGTSLGLPETQHMPSPAEEASPHSSACASDFPEPCDNMPHCSSEQATPVRPPLNTFHLHSSVHLYSPIPHSTEGQTVPENRKDCLSHAQRAKRLTSRWKYVETGKSVSPKRKQMPEEEEPSETFSSPSCSSLEAVGQCSTGAVAKSSKPNKHLRQYPPLKFVSTPKKRRFKETQDQQSPVCPQCNCTDKLLKKGTEQEPIGIVTNKSKQTGVQQKESAEEDCFYFIHHPPTPELCSQVQSVRISRALLGWARWVFSNMQKQ